MIGLLSHWAVRLFERWVFRRVYLRREAAVPAGEALRREAEGLDTPWRVATYLQSALIEGPAYRRFDVPRPPETSLAGGRGNSADYARLAQAVFTLNGRRAFLVCAYDAGSGAPKMACAVQDAPGGDWHHISDAGMFGIYASMQEIVSDIVDDWWLWLARDERMRIVAWHERKGEPKGADGA